MDNARFLIFVKTKTVQRAVYPWDVTSVKVNKVSWCASCFGIRKYAVIWNAYDDAKFETRQEAEEFAQKLMDIGSKWIRAVKKTPSNRVQVIYKNFEMECDVVAAVVVEAQLLDNV